MKAVNVIRFLKDKNKIKSNWIDAKKQLPERKLGNLSNPVLVIIGEDMAIMRCDVTGKRWTDSDNRDRLVSYWMPLPIKPIK